MTTSVAYRFVGLFPDPTYNVLEGLRMRFCDSCYYFDTNGPKDETDGLCRRFPPAPSAKDDIGNGFPIVTPTDWCGEWQEDKDSIER
jgi:hypothetical protein